MELSYVARGENLRRRKKPKSITFLGKFLSLPSEIVALSSLMNPSCDATHETTQLFTLPTRGDKRNLDSSFPLPMDLFLEMFF